MSLPGVSLEQKQALYNTAVENRTVKVMEALALADAGKSNRVHDAIIAHYNALKSRDEAITAELNYLNRKSDEWKTARAEMLAGMNPPLHQQFITRLSNDLTPEQLELVKDKLTYGKVAFTYSGYCAIVPGLTEEDKAGIMDLLKQAREAAMEGGNSTDKTAIFEHYKKKINANLSARGIDVEKAIKTWNEKQKAAAKTTEAAATPGTNTSN
jgi:hypothetical protein